MKLLLTLALACGSLVAEAPADVKLWNEARAQLVVMGQAEQVFTQAAKDWTVAKNEELATPGSVSVDALRKFTAMWVAWQNYLTEQRKAAKLMHDFSVVEMNQQ
jgi:hypothetical protein